MSDTISKRAVLDKFQKICDSCWEYEKHNGVMCGTCYLDGAISIVEDMPSAQPERKRGKWIDKGWNGDWQYQTDGRGRSWHEWQCSECNDITKGAKWDFCPNCGADMRGEEDECTK